MSYEDFEGNFELNHANLPKFNIANKIASIVQLFFAATHTALWVVLFSIASLNQNSKGIFIVSIGIVSLVFLCWNFVISRQDL